MIRLPVCLGCISQFACRTDFVKEAVALEVFSQGRKPRVVLHCGDTASATA
jgi:hypothetical protein